MGKKEKKETVRAGHLVLWLAVGLLGGCDTATNTTDTTTLGLSGVEGRVLIGPNCPIMTDDNPCPDQPFEASLTVTGSDGRVVARARSNAEGNFRIPLSPGNYVLVPEAPNPLGPPFAEPIPFRVSEETWTQLTVRYDSGIR